MSNDSIPTCTRPCSTRSRAVCILSRGRGRDVRVVGRRLNEIAEHTPGHDARQRGQHGGEPGSSGIESRPDRRPAGRGAAAMDITRFDVFTFRLAMNHLATARPRAALSWLSPKRTTGHTTAATIAGRRLHAHRSVPYRELWTWLQSDCRLPWPNASAHHHRSRPRPYVRWTGGVHRPTSAGSGEAWMAFVSPRMAQRGVWREHPAACRTARLPLQSRRGWASTGCAFTRMPDSLSTSTDITGS